MSPDFKTVKDKTKIFHTLKTALIILPVLSFWFSCYGQTGYHKELASILDAISTSPEIIHFANSHEINNSGGHLQGIQTYHHDGGSYLFLTGSSDTYSYCAVVKLGESSEVIQVSRLMDKPFKHAGVFQIYENLLAVGIEDNDLKNKSKVCIYDISEPGAPLDEPLAVIDREGEKYRSTAGCTAIAEFRGNIILAAGDWDTRNIDFYYCSAADFPDEEFTLFCSFNSKTASKKGWADRKWNAWQNINLFNIEDNLYLVGLGRNENKENEAALFSITGDINSGFKLKKLNTAIFECIEDCSFSAGAGVEFKSKHEPVIYACGYNIDDISVVNRFTAKVPDNIPLTAHSHNDYEQERPLFEALENRFMSIEADIYSVGNSIYVAHDFDKINPERTLQSLYLEPLKNLTGKNKSVYDDGQELFLMIDIKDDGLKTYKLLHNTLKRYRAHLSFYKKGKKKQGAVTVVISGNRPVEYMKSQKKRFAAADGRIDDLDSGNPPEFMPFVSDNWSKYFKWNGKGEMPENEKNHLNELAAKARGNGYLLRFWGTPNATKEQRISVWAELKNAGVGLIGADHLKELKEFLQSETNTSEAYKFQFVSLLEDKHFQNGIFTRGSNAGEIYDGKTLYPFGKGNKEPVWTLSEWGSRFSVGNVEMKVTGKERIFKNAGKTVSFSGSGDEILLRLEVNASKEYTQPRKPGESWPHLLLEQEFRTKFKLNDIENLILSFEGRLLECKLLMDGQEYDTNLHTAQFQLFITVQDWNPDSAGYGDYLWFGVPFYDYRYEKAELYAARDIGKSDNTGKFIYSIGSDNFTDESFHNRKWIKINVNLKPYIIQAWEMAKERGFLKHSDIADAVISGMNIGWEVPGTFDAEFEFKNFDISVEK